MIDQEFLEIFACPADGCRAGFRLVDEPAGPRLVCTGCGLRFPVRDGLPILLIDEAEKPTAPGTGAERT